MEGNDLIHLRKVDTDARVRGSEVALHTRAARKGD